MRWRIWTIVALTTLGFSVGATDQHLDKKFVPRTPMPITTITGTITLKSNTGKPAGKGELRVNLSRLASNKPMAQWVELGSQTITINLGENETGPWKYTIKVSLPVHAESKTAPAPALPVAVFAMYKGPWSVSTGGGPIRAASPVFNLKIGKTNVVDLVLKAELIN